MSIFLTSSEGLKYKRKKSNNVLNSLKNTKRLWVKKPQEMNFYQIDPKKI